MKALAFSLAISSAVLAVSGEGFAQTVPKCIGGVKSLNAQSSTGQELLDCLLQMNQTMAKQYSSVLARARKAESAVRTLERRMKDLETKIQSEPLPTMDGAVVAFAQKCPAGWSAYYPAAGRFLVGAGDHAETSDHRNKDENKKDLAVFTGPDDLSYETLREPNAANTGGKLRVGGREKVVLTAEHVHDHQHILKWFGEGNLSLNGIPAVTDWPKNYQIPYTSSRTGARDDGFVAASGGENAPHDNMPPFLALYFCVKS